MIDRTGQQIGSYHLLRLLGKGGFAEVYLAQHQHLDTLVAIKLLHTYIADSDISIFLHEARILGHLVHPHIVRVLDFGVHDGVPFLIMDYAPNGTLRRQHPRGSQLPPETVVHYVKEIADALYYAHNEHLIHRDIKPENLLVGRHNEIVLSDFGIALQGQSSLLQSTQDVAGTVVYMAPEQFQGKPRPASDQYSLGIVGYEWLCGTLPFHGSFVEIASQHLFMAPPSLVEKVPDIPPELEKVVMTALAKDPKQRFANVQVFADALEQAFLAARTIERPAQPSIMPILLPPIQGLTDEREDIPTSQPPGLPTAQSASTQPIQQPSTVPQIGTYGYSDMSTPPMQPPWFAAQGVEVTQDHEGMVPERHSFQSDQPRLIPPESFSYPFSSAALPKHPGISRAMASVLIGLVVVIVLSSFVYFFTHLPNSFYPPVGATTTGAAAHVNPGGTWTDDLPGSPDSLLPNAGRSFSDGIVDQALYTPLFVGDANGKISMALAAELPTTANGGVSADLQTWTFKLKADLKWSDGQSLNADDVDYTWRLWNATGFNAFTTQGFNLITSADVSADKLSITFHLKKAYEPFLSLWVDSVAAPLPKHHFNTMAPDAIRKSADSLNPSVVSGPFKLSASVPNDHFTLVRNPNYYQASAGLPYLDKVIFRSSDQTRTIADLQSGSITSSWSLNIDKLDTYKALQNYALVANPKSANYEFIEFNFKNPTLDTDQALRKAISIAIDRNNLMQVNFKGQALLLCTDHGSIYNPGYQANADCPKFDPEGAKSLLDHDGWNVGLDGIRAKAGQKLQFKYVISDTWGWRTQNAQAIAKDLKVIGIDLIVKTYTSADFFGTVLPQADFDMAEFENGPQFYDAGDTTLAACNQLPTGNINYGSYCNPELDALYNSEQANIFPLARQSIFDSIHQIYLNDLPFIVLYSPRDLAIVKHTAHNYQPGVVGAMEDVNIWQWWCDNSIC